jgi:glyoxalase family protein
MSHPIRGLHHVTATVAGAQEDLDFATGALGLRLVKRTVNFDNHDVYHFYYGNESGTPGTVWTTFPYRDKGIPVGQKGLGQITVTSLSVPVDSLEFWRARMQQRRLGHLEQPPRFGHESLLVTDPSGLAMELVATADDDRRAWTGNGVPADVGIRGLHSVTLHSRAPHRTQQLLTELLGFSQVDRIEGRIRLGVGAAGAGEVVEILDDQTAPPARNGLGTVHHVAFAISDEQEQLRLREELVRGGLQVTEVLDRSYFRSIYFREPGGILFEVATVGPGFAIDEEPKSLGSSLKLPPWEEKNRSAIEAVLPAVRYLPAESLTGFNTRS